MLQLCDSTHVLRVCIPATILQASRIEKHFQHRTLSPFLAHGLHLCRPGFPPLGTEFFAIVPVCIIIHFTIHLVCAFLHSTESTLNTAMALASLIYLAHNRRNKTFWQWKEWFWSAIAEEWTWNHRLARSGLLQTAVRSFVDTPRSICVVDSTS